MIKQSRLKVEGSTEIQFESENTNNWCSRIFSNLKQKYEKSRDNSLLQDLSVFWSQLSNSVATSNQPIQPPTSYLTENTIKSLLLQTQFSLYLLQNLFEFDSINQASGQESTEPSFSVIEKLGNSSSQKQHNLFHNITSLLQKEIRFFYDFIKCQVNSPQIAEKSQLDEEEMDLCLKKEDNFEFVDSTCVKIDNKQAIQVYCSLIEQLSVLFTRVKNHTILNEFLLEFAPSIELISELSSISRLAPQPVSTPTQAHNSHLNSHFRYSNSHNEKILIQLQSNRRSNDLYDTFSMQIASLIQNNLTKTYSYHEFDSILLESLEPIFFSFLTYSHKLSLKQKSLQAWNSTFGKSTVSSLKYSKRLEKLFVEIREEMIDKSKSSTGSTSGIFAISLPGFKPIDLLLINQGATTTNSTFIQEPCDHEFMHDENEKENTPENLKNLSSILNSSDKGEQTVVKDVLVNESSSSVPMAHFLNSNKIVNETVQSQSNNLATNFVFSPAGRNSFLNQLNNQTQSASKVSALKTPEAKNLRPRPSPQSLNHNSKRKLDLNVLIDQMPDKEFTEISKASNCDLMKRIDKGSKPSVFKQPLTEHQKEVRKQKSFIPMEIQAVCDELEPTMDSQMSCSMQGEDTNTQFNQLSDETPKAILQFSSIANKSGVALDSNEDQMELDTELQEKNVKKVVKQDEKSSQDEKNIHQSVFKFQSKMNPSKQIELFQVEVAQSEEDSASSSPIKDAGKRRSARLKLKEEVPAECVQQEAIEPVEKKSSSKILTLLRSNRKSRLAKFEKQKMRKNSLKNSKKMNLFKSKFSTGNNGTSAMIKKNLSSLKYRKLIIRNIKQQQHQDASNKQYRIKKNSKKLKILQKINQDLNNEEKPEEKVKNTEEYQEAQVEIKEPGDVSMISENVEDNEDKPEDEVEDDEDDEPLFKLVEKRNLTTKEDRTEIDESTTVSDQTPIILTNKTSLEPLIEEVVSSEPEKQDLGASCEPMLTDSSAKPTPGKLPSSKSATTDDLITKLNNTPTTSILKKRLSRLTNAQSITSAELVLSSFVKDPVPSNLNSNLNTVIENGTPNNKRRVSFCDSVQVEEIEPNFNKSCFNRSTPRLQNKAKIVLSPYFAKNNINTSTPQTSSSTTPNQNLQTTDSNKSELTCPSPSASNPAHQLVSMNVPSSPSSSLIDFFSNNKQNFLSQRSTIIQQQMLQHQSKYEPQLMGSPLANRGLSTSLVLAPNTSNVDSPKAVNKSTIDSSSLTPQIDHKSEALSLLQNISTKLKNCKISLQVLFEQIDTSLYMNKLGSIKYFKFKNVLTIGEFCSLNPSEVNALPLKAPKIENFSNLIQKFEEKCADLINKSSVPVTVEVKASTAQMGSVEEEMERLESTTCLDTSIESEPVGEAIINVLQSQSEVNISKTVVDQQQSNMEIDPELVALQSKALNDAVELFGKTLGSIKVDSNMDLGVLLDLSGNVGEARLKLTQSLNNVQEIINNIVRSRVNGN